MGSVWQAEGLWAVHVDYAIGARTIVNGQVGYEADHWAAYIFANNIFDEHYIQYPRASEGLALLGDPRVIGARLEARW